MHLCGININLQRVLVQDTHDLQAGNECQSLYSFLGANNGMKSICTGGIKGLVQNGKWSTTRWNGTFLHHVAAHFHFGQELDNKGKAQKAKGTFSLSHSKNECVYGPPYKRPFFLLLALFCFFLLHFSFLWHHAQRHKSTKVFPPASFRCFFFPPQGQQSCLCHQTCPVSSVVNKLHYSSGKWTSESWPAIWNATTKLSVITEEGARDTHTHGWIKERFHL